MEALKPGKPEQSGPLMGILAILAGAVALFFWVTPLHTFRPASQENPNPPQERRLPARMWQDPIQQARESIARAGTEGPQGKVNKLPRFAADARVLAVTVYGGYAQLDTETRLRSRFAVELALNDKGYVPDGDDTEFLRFIILDVDGEDGRTSRKVLPFEVWLNEGPHLVPSQVLVLWIDDTLLGSKPRQMLARLLDQAGITGNLRAELRMIGPTSSSGLKDLIEEGGGWPVLIHSPWATADEAFLFDTKRDLDKLDLPQEIERTIATDRQACGRLVEELIMRQMRIGTQDQPGDRIAVLSEWDTGYGRALPVTFAACVMMAKSGKNCGDDRPDYKTEFRHNVRLLLNGESWPPEVLRVFYLRGLDGIGPRSLGETPKKSSTDKSSSEDIERSDGPSQLDYARRLADLVSRDFKPRAVGVLGADIYDKLLLLQAMRNKVPGALFFTTDLDAAYVHPSQNEWSRNLLVASGFGLYQMSDNWSEVRPPFRDTYGVAIQRAVDHATTGVHEDPPAPSIYEIGRTEAHLLPTGAPGEQAMVLGQAFGSHVLWLVLFMILAGILLVMHMGRSGFWWWLAGLAILCAVLLMLSKGMRLEPLLWTEGISIWPTEILRAIATVAAVVLLQRTQVDLSKNFGDLGDSKFAEPAPSGGLFLRVKRAWPRLVGETPQAGGDAKTLWHWYAETEDTAGRWLRASSVTVLILGVIGIALEWERPMRPCRGDFSCNLDVLMASLSMASALLTTCYVADATAACTRWIRSMLSAPIRWPGTGNLPDAWYDVEIVARRTQVVGRLILYPFILLLVLIFSRSQVFDRWPWPTSLIILFGLPLVLALVSALHLRSSAEQLRSQARASVRAMWAEAISSGDHAKAGLAEAAMKSIESESRGAFSPFTQNPVLAALMLPLGGAGTGMVLERLLQSL